MSHVDQIEKVQALRQLQEDMRALHDRSALSTLAADMQLKGVHVQTIRYREQDDLMGALRSPAGQGWVEFSGAVQVVTPEAPLHASQGHVLSADLVVDGRSLRVRSIAGGWLFSRISETEVGAPDSVPALVCDSVHLGLRGANDRLHYRLAYTLVDGSLMPFDAWFVRFGRTVD